MAWLLLLLHSSETLTSHRVEAAQGVEVPRGGSLLKELQIKLDITPKNRTRVRVRAGSASGITLQHSKASAQRPRGGGDGSPSPHNKSTRPATAQRSAAQHSGSRPGDSRWPSAKPGSGPRQLRAAPQRTAREEAGSTQAAGQSTSRSVCRRWLPRLISLPNSPW